MKEIPITSFDNLQIGQAENAAAGTGPGHVVMAGAVQNASSAIAMQVASRVPTTRSQAPILGSS